MPLCGRLFLETKLLFLFDLRAELRISFGSRGLTGEKGIRQDSFSAGESAPAVAADRYSISVGVPHALGQLQTAIQKQYPNDLATYELEYKNFTSICSRLLHPTCSPIKGTYTATGGPISMNFGTPGVCTWTVTTDNVQAIYASSINLESDQATVLWARSTVKVSKIDLA
ncbi:MAG: hypothetical protein JWQ42_3130 [Edaphobacter sp.]|nr:hypothetical protein [Edaphobacter sp.]